MENKQAICDALLTTLQLTRRYEDIQSIDYDANTETVTVTYNLEKHLTRGVYPLLCNAATDGYKPV